MADVATSGGSVKVCCQQAENLRVIEDRPHARVQQCQVCGCRHFRAFMGQTLQPGHVVIGAQE